MRNLLLFLFVWLAWGFSWYPVKVQVEQAPVAISLALRFAFAAALLFPLVMLRGRRLRFGLRDQGLMLLLGLCNFGFNYYLYYFSMNFLVSGVTALIFSALVIVNGLVALVYWRNPLPALFWLGASLGLVGLALVVWDDLRLTGWSAEVGLALVLTNLGTLFVAVGTTVVVHLKQRGVPVLSSNAWAMFYGALVMGAFAVAGGQLGQVPGTGSYWLALVYSVVPATVVAFLAFHALIGSWGAARASYVTVLVPLPALLVSWWVPGEVFVWTPLVILGVALMLLGNVLVLRQRG